ncbi:MAG: acyltransferase [Pseudomonadota bacterium]
MDQQLSKKISGIYEKLADFLRPDYQKKILTHRNNFDFLRLVLALGVVFSHFIKPLSLPLVESFFVISGFLITDSLLRENDLRHFFVKRFCRIYPSILVMFFMLLIVAILSKQNFIYITSIFHLLIFQDLAPIAQIRDHIYAHGAFWSLVIELQFYLLIPLIVFYWKSFPKITFAILILFYILSFFITQKILRIGDGIQVLTFRQSIFSNFSFFIGGFFLRIYFSKIKKYLPLLALIMLWPLLDSNSLFFPLALSVMVVSFACIFYFGKICFFGDLSYGIYLYHFPIFYILTNHTKVNNLPPQYGLSLILLALVIFAFLSFHLIEKRCIKFGKSV